MTNPSLTPFQTFRFWARRAPVGERVTAAGVGLLAVVTLGWLLVPASGNGPGGSRVAVESSSTGGGVASGGPSGGRNASAVAPTASSRPGAGEGGGGGVGSGGSGAGAGNQGDVVRSRPGAPTAAAGAAVGSGGCSPPPGEDQGVSAREVKVAITLINIVGPAGNSTFDVPSVAEQQLDYQQDIDALNAEGGVACRKLVPQFYSANPVDQSDLQQKCLDITEAKPFLVIESGGYTGSASITCFPQHHLPLFGSGLITGSQRDQFYPYMFGAGRWETLYRNAVLALQARGFFGAPSGFKKLGVIYRSCLPEVNAAFMKSVQQAGVPASLVVTYDVGCPSGFATPSDMQQAILKFKQNGVTHVSENLFYTDFANFTRIAQQQGFKPKYGIADDGIVPITKGFLHPDYANIANAVAITSNRFAEEQTPGMTPTAGTAKCDAIYKAHGRAPVYQHSVGFGGLTCNLVWMVAAAINHAPTLRRSALADGLHAAKAVDFSFPSGPADFGGARVTYGDEFWRPLEFLPSCTCWRVIDPTFRPSL